MLFPAIIAMFGMATVSAQTISPSDGTTRPTPSPIDEATEPAGGEAPTPPRDGGGWNLSVGIPVWVPGIGGDLAIKGREFSPDQDTGDTIDVLDTHLNAGAALHLEAHKGRLGFFGDLLYVDLRGTGNETDGDAEAVFKGFVGELGTFYTVVAPPHGRKGWGAFRLDALGGVRVSALELGIDADAFDVSTTNTIYDPIVGARAELGLTNWLAAKARGDVGGFGIDAWDTSDFTWNVETGLEFHLAKWCDLDLGYRWLKYDLVSDSGNASFDATLAGPFVGLTFNF